MDFCASVLCQSFTICCFTIFMYSYLAWLSTKSISDASIVYSTIIQTFPLNPLTNEILDITVISSIMVAIILHIHNGFTSQYLLQLTKIYFYYLNIFFSLAEYKTFIH